MKTKHLNKPNANLKEMFEAVSVLRLFILFSIFTLAAVSIISAQPAAPAEQCPSGMVSYWKFDEGSGTTASDSVDANDGTISNADWTTGKVGNALSFDSFGNNQVTVQDSDNLHMTDQLTIEFWMNSPSPNYGGQGQLFVKQEMFWSYGIKYNSDGSGSSPPSIEFDIENAWNGWNSPYPFEANAWYHVACTYDGNNKICYVNGNEIGREAVSGSMNPDTESGFIRIGYQFEGSMDEVAIYNRALTTDEIAAHYQNGLAGNGYCETQILDSDGDGILDMADNCPNVVNPGQEDSDGDGVGDVCDNCLNAFNPDQADQNGDGIGDACQDSDGDSVFDNVDNCLTTSNPDQADSDGNGIGDACQDTDGDGILDNVDNCLTIFNPDQADTDSDGRGDACDNCLTISNPDQADSEIGVATCASATEGRWITVACDTPGTSITEILRADYINYGSALSCPTGGMSPTCHRFCNIAYSCVGQTTCSFRVSNSVCGGDPCSGTYKKLILSVMCGQQGDGVGDACDNCPNTFNPDQADSDSNGIGNVCQDTDGDGVFDNVDNCLTTSNPDQADSDGNGIGDACQDTDGDGILDMADNCPNVVNPGQADQDGDGVGDVCDNCPNAFNPDQADQNGDGIGDACQDTDGDGLFDNVDNCPWVSNPDQADTNNNGIGDACDDTDGDGVFDNVDNCLMIYNPDQTDQNGDGMGDACQDSDGDGLFDNVDNCPLISNPDQADTDIVSVPVCASANEGNQINIACVAPITEILRADYIDYDSALSCPTGGISPACHRFCNIANSCVGQTTCSFGVGNDECGGDPCSGTYKRLILSVLCGQGDGVGDACDPCPTEPGPINGCPIILDSDGDGVNDDVDSCPNIAGRPAYIGCPVGENSEVTMNIQDQDKTGECGCRQKVIVKTSDFKYGSGCNAAKIVSPKKKSGETAYIECSDAHDLTTVTIYSSALSNTGALAVNRLKVNGRDLTNFVYKGTDANGSYIWQTSVPKLKSSDKLQAYLSLHKAVTGTCKIDKTCTDAVEAADVKVFNRADPAFIAAWTSSPKETNYPAIFESSAGLVASCITDETGTCIAGEPSAGKYLAIAKFKDDSINQIVYIGRNKEPGDFKDTNNDKIGDFADKDFQVTKVIDKGVVSYKPSSKLTITGSIDRLTNALFGDEADIVDVLLVMLIPVIAFVGGFYIRDLFAKAKRKKEAKRKKKK